MKINAAYDQVRASRRDYHQPNKADVSVTTYIGTNIAQRRAAGLVDEKWEPEGAATYPMAFLVEQHAHAITPPHFHRADQFQVFVGGSGEFGGQAVKPVTLHFAGAYSPYGPIVAGPGGIDYFTLRNGWDAGPQWMPEKRSELKASGRKYRGIVAASWTQASKAELASSTYVTSTALIEPEPDGCAAWAFRLPPDATFTGPDPAAGGGQYWLAFNGSCVADGARMTRLSCLFLSPDESPLGLKTGSEGVEVIAMQYPRDR
jgi:hypothetical protein